jgi:beta-lactamase superfamily II metal-dependent hydrolase
MKRDYKKFIFKKLNPFKWFVLENFPFIEEDFDSITNWQLFCKLGEYMNKVICKLNEIGEQTEDLISAFIELQNYINEYFENLDIQEEINNKLDEMAEDGTLASIINEQIFNDLNNKIKVLNAESTIAFLAPSSSEKIDFGDCAVITGVKNIIVDLGNQPNAQILINYLRENNINKIDYIVISHYHDDHIGSTGASGLIALLSQTDIDFSDCTVLLPHKNINYGLFVPISAGTGYQNLENTIINILNTNNIVYKYPEEKEIITIDENTQMQFFNLLPEYYNNYYGITYNAYNTETGTTDYNNFSMVMSYTHLNHVAWFTGDIEPAAQANIYKNIKQCDILKIEHHGLNFNSNNNYLNNLQPKYAVVCNRAYYDTPFDFANNTTIKILSQGAKFFDTRTANQPIKFVSKYNEITCLTNTISQINYNTINGWGSQNIKDGDDLNLYTTPRFIFLSICTTCTNIIKWTNWLFWKYYVW